MSPARHRSLRDRILRRDQYRCVYCGEEFEPRQLTLDHVQPRMRGGDHSEGNLVASCQACNIEKGSLPAWAYLSDRPMQRANFLRLAQGVWDRHRRAILKEARKQDET